jgi:Mg2+/Co2+ transporter CorC
MEDVVEQIVGEIADEHDEELGPDLVRQADGSYLANARASLEDATAIIGPEFDVGEVANEVDTLAGYVATRIGRVPVRGELVPGPGPFEIEILDADPRRVKKLKIYRSLDRQRGADPRRRPGEADKTATAAAPAGAPAPRPELPVAGDESVKLSPDAAPSKSARRP